MSVENKIRQFLENATVTEAYPGFGKSKEEESPMQGSSQKPEVNNLDKGAGADAAMKAGNATSLAAGSGPMEKSNPTQGSSNASPEQEDLGTDQPGKVASQKMSMTGKKPMGHGAGQAKTTTASVDPRTVVNQPNSKGNVHQEETEVEVSEDEFISEEEFNALSAEEQAEYELVEIEEGMKKEMEDEDESEEKKMKMKKMKEQFDADVKSLFGEEANLSEEFKNKAASLFEAVVTARVADLKEQIENEAAETAAELVESYVEGIVEKVDEYLNYVVEKWLEENQVAVVEGLRNEVTEEFMEGLRNLFAEHYIEVPEEKYDVLGEMTAKIEELESSLNNSMSESIELKKELVSLKRESVVASVTEDLAQTEVEKFKSLVEDVTFEDEASFVEKLNVIKENYFPKNAAVQSSDLDDVVETIVETEGTVAKYAQAISRRAKF